MPYSVKGFFEINEDMVQILLMLEVLFTQDSKVEDLFCGASSGSEPSLFFSNYFFSLAFQPIQDDFEDEIQDEIDSLLLDVIVCFPKWVWSYMKVFSNLKKKKFACNCLLACIIQYHFFCPSKISF